MTNENRSFFYRWWPTALAGLIGMVVALALIGVAVYSVHDGDMKILISVILGGLMGLPVGQICILVHDRRNPWD